MLEMWFGVLRELRREVIKSPRLFIRFSIGMLCIRCNRGFNYKGVWKWKVLMVFFSAKLYD